MAFDPWAQTNSGISRLNDTLTSLNQMQTQDATNARASRLSDLQFNDAKAKQDALIQATGAPDLATAYKNQAQTEQLQAQQKADSDGLKTLVNVMELAHKAGIPGESVTALAKLAIAQNPRMKGMADHLNVIDHQGAEGTRMFADGELKDPITGKPLPAGFYETKGVWTGDAANPMKLTSYKLASPPKVDHVPEGAAIPDGKGGYTVPAPKADKVEKGFDTVDLGDKVKVVPRDGSKPYYENKAAKPDTVIKLDNSNSKPKATKPLPAGQLDALSDQKKLIDNLSEARALADEKDKRGNYVVDTGPVVGRLQSLGEKGNLASDKFITYKQKLSTVNNIMLKLRSGAAVTEQEYSRFLKEMPDENTPTNSRAVKLDAAINYAKTLMDERVTNYDEGGYKVPAHLLGGQASDPAAAKPAGKVASKGKQSSTLSDPLGIRRGR